METNQIIQGDCIEIMKKMEENSVDAIITDPPYGLEFMGKEWDKFSGYQKENLTDPKEFKSVGRIRYYRKDGTPVYWNKPTYVNKQFKFIGKNQDKKNQLMENFFYYWASACLRVLKPGGFLLSFGGTRTYHRLVCGIEDAGFEIRDTIMWLYGSGFPKSLNIGKQIDKIKGFNNVEYKEPIGREGRKQKPNGNPFNTDYEGQNGKIPYHKPTSKEAKEWEGWGTALKPACEPIVVARKPLSEKNVALNVLKWGTGGINIDGCRVGTKTRTNAKRDQSKDGDWGMKNLPTEIHDYGRFPANIILDETAGQMLDEQSGELSNSSRPNRLNNKVVTPPFKGFSNDKNTEWKPEAPEHNDKGGASRFFYCAKSSKRERNLGTESFINVEVLKVICKEKNLTKEERLAQLLVDMETLQGKVIEESGIQNKKDIEWNTILFGKSLMEKYQKDLQSIIKMKTNSTIQSKILNWLKFLLTKEYTLDVNSLMESGGNPVENVEKSKELIITINEKLESVLGVKDVVSGMQLKIKLKEGRNIHPTCKPIKLMEYLIKLVSKQGATILDPFIGSGTTAIACLKLNRKFIGIEKEEEYVKIAKTRIKPFLEQRKLI